MKKNLEKESYTWYVWNMVYKSSSTKKKYAWWITVIIR